MQIHPEQKCHCWRILADAVHEPWVQSSQHLNPIVGERPQSINPLFMLLSSFLKQENREQIRLVFSHVECIYYVESNPSSSQTQKQLIGQAN